MRTVWKRLWVAFMALSLCLQLLPRVSLAVEAVPDDREDEVRSEEELDSAGEGDGGITDDEIQLLEEQGIILGSFDTEEEMLAWLQAQGDGVPLADGGIEGPSIDGEYGIMRTALVGGNVDPGYFYFTVWSANEAERKGKYADFSALADASDVTVTSGKTWRGPASGEVSAAESGYPALEGYELSSVRINGTRIRRLGNVTVRDKTYVYFSALTTTGEMTHIVLSDDPGGYGAGAHPIEVRYVPSEYHISYEVSVDGVRQEEGNAVFGLDAIFGRRRPASTVDLGYAFSVTIPAGYEGEVKVADAAGGERTVYPQTSGREQEYGEYKLGSEVEYKARMDGGSQIGAEVDTSAPDAPRYFSLSGTYYPTAGAKAAGDQTVKVSLTQKSRITFDPTFWLDSPNIRDKIVDVETLDKAVVLERSELPKTAPAALESGGWIGANGLFNYQWVFKASHAPFPKIWKVDALAVNGTGLEVPFTEVNLKGERVTVFPSGTKVTLSYDRNRGTGYTYILKVENAFRDIVITGGSLVDYNDFESVPTALTGVTAEYWNGTAWKPLVQSKPVAKGEFQISSSVVDKGHFDANLRFKLLDGYGWPGNDPDQAVTATIDGKYNAGTIGKASGPDGDGYYYKTLNGSQYWTGKYTDMTYLLNIKAVPLRYAVEYLGGANAAFNRDANVDHVTGMPVFNTSSSVDANLGSYYTLTGAGASDAVIVPGTAPVNLDAANGTSEAEFAGWVLTDEKGDPYQWEDGRYSPVTRETLSEGCPIYAPNDVIDLDSIFQCAALADAPAQIYRLYLTALWSAGAADFRYYVTFNYEDEAGEEHVRARTGVDGVPSNRFTAEDNEDNDAMTYGEDQYYMVRRANYFRLEAADGLSVAFDTESAKALALREAYPWYRFDTARSGSAEYAGEFYWDKVSNGGEVAVWMISTLGRLDVGKTLSNSDLVNSGEDYTIDVAFALPGENDPDTLGNEAEYFGGGPAYKASYLIHDSEGKQSTGSIDLTFTDGQYTGELRLKNGQTASVPLPGGTTYTVSEKADSRYVLEKVTGTGEDLESGNGQSGSIAANAIDSIAFTNALTSTLTVSKTVAGSAGDTGREFHFTVTLSDPSINGRMGDMEFIDGVASFTLKHGETAVAVLHPNEREVSYEVTEDEADRYGYTTTSTGATGLILPGRDAVAEFVNTKNLSPWWPDRDQDGQWQPPEDLDYLDHTAYIAGFPDGLVHPLDNLTRAEAAMIFYRLLTDEALLEHQITASPYPDVPEDAWYGEAVATLSHMGVIHGLPDGTFRPDADITRAEFVKIAVGFFSFQNDAEEDQFSDIAGHWARTYINAASVHELIHGYPDGTFRPEGKITRAETIRIVNNVLGRKPHVDGMLGGMTTWPDNMDQSAWYYADIQEATNSHAYSMDLLVQENVYERWIAMLTDDGEKRGEAEEVRR